MKYNHEVIWVMHRFCSYACPYCCAKSLKDKEQFEFINRNIEAAKQFFNEHIPKNALIILSGGEISETPEFVNVCNDLSKDYMLGVYTNLIWKPEFLNEFIEKINPEKIEYIWATLHTKTINNKRCFDTFMKTAERLKQSGYSIIANTIIPKTPSSLINIYQKFKEINVSMLYRFLYDNREIFKYDKKYIPLIKQLIVFKNEYKKISTGGYLNFRGLPCQAGHRALVITDDGRIRKCAHTPDILGNIHEPTSIQLFPTIQKCDSDACACISYMMHGHVDAPDCNEIDLLDFMKDNFYKYDILEQK